MMAQSKNRKPFKPRIKLVSLKPRYYAITQDHEMLRSNKNNPRANVLLLKLKFRNMSLMFAVPWRSNVKNTDDVTSCTYSLPPTTKTTNGHKAALDFRKMCPVPKSSELYALYHLNKFSSDLNTSLKIEKGIKEIIEQAQDYLNKYPTSNTQYRVDIDAAIDNLNAAGYRF